eukprot:COSAG02_NODE_2288_length_9212_cov_11.304071_2_plen_48_part_00
MDFGQGGPDSDEALYWCTGTGILYSDSEFVDLTSSLILVPPVPTDCH